VRACCWGPPPSRRGGHSRRATYGQAAQHVVLLRLTIPPLSRQRCSDGLILHLEPQLSGFVGSQESPLLTHVEVAASHVSVGMLHTTKPGLPQVDLAAHRVTLPLQFLGSISGSRRERLLTAWATQLTYRPWLAESQGHAARSACTAHRAGSQSTVARTRCAPKLRRIAPPKAMAVFRITPSLRLEISCYEVCTPSWSP
jgi:hypothetical protein